MAKETKNTNTKNAADSASKIEVIKNLIFGENIAEYNSEFETLKKEIDLKRNELQKYIDEYDGEIVHGVLVTESGLLAAAHLGGAGSVKKWFRTGKVRRDGNGVTITTYMTKFSGYKLDLN